MASPGFIWVFASSAHMGRTLLLADSLTDSSLDPLELVDRSQGWMCVFSVCVADVPTNLRALAERLNLPHLDTELQLKPVRVTKALHEVVTGEVRL